MPSMNLAEKVAQFRALHERAPGFVMPNPWDPGSARLLASLGFEALATSSGAAAGVMGRRDGQLNREEALAHAAAIAAATGLPVSADLENGFGAAPETVAETIRLAAERGLAGASVEDATGVPEQPLFEFNLAVERVTAAVEAARACPFPMVITARAENFVRGPGDLDDVIRRLQAYQTAGADVLFAPALPDLEAVRTVCSSVQRPVNFMVGLRGKSFPAEALFAAGVRRISLAASLFRAAMSGLLQAAREVRESGTFSYVERTLNAQEFNRLLGE